MGPNLTPAVSPDNPTVSGSNNTAGSATAANVSKSTSAKMRKAAESSKYDVTLIGQRKIGRGLDFYSLQREQQLGKELAADVEHSSRLVTDAMVNEYVNRIGQNLVRNSDAKVPFVIKVLDNDEINAFALPGGYFYVNSGLILAAENESELAGVMAHEIAHVAARHATKAATRAEIWNVASIPLIFMAGPVGYAIQSASSLVVPMSFLKFSRDAEREADLLGLQYEYAAGYDPQAFVAFFERLETVQKKKHSALAKAFMTHPMTGDRIRRAQDEIAEMLPAKDEYVVSTSEFDAVQGHLAELMSRHQIDEGHVTRPVLRKRTEDTKSGGPTLNKKNSF